MEATKQQRVDVGALSGEIFGRMVDRVAEAHTFFMHREENEEGGLTELQQSGLYAATLRVFSGLERDIQDVLRERFENVGVEVWGLR